MLKLERLKIDKFRNVKPGSEIRFADGFNIVLGRNGTGKTTLLDLISRIVRWNFSDLQTEEFSIAYELKLADRSVQLAISNRTDGVTTPIPSEAIEFSHQSQTFIPLMHARITSNEGTTAIEYCEGILRVNGEVTAPPKFGSLLSEHTVILLIVLYGRGAIYPKLKSAFSAVRFDESLDLFRLTWDSPDSPGFFVGGRGPLLPLLVTRPPMPSELLDAIGLQYGTEPKFTSVALTDDKLDFLLKVVGAMKFAKAELRVDVLARNSTPLEGTVVQMGNMIARFFFPDGGFITQDRLSYGQKRLLMFYYYLAANPDVVIADELVNGLHHQWITACIDEIGERQAFLTSQNPLLLDYLPFSSPEHVRKSFVLCTSELDENQKPIWSWSNMSEDASQEFYSAYEVGIEHVSEILQSQGLF